MCVNTVTNFKGFWLRFLLDKNKPSVALVVFKILKKSGSDPQYENKLEETIKSHFFLCVMTGTSTSERVF